MKSEKELFDLAKQYVMLSEEFKKELRMIFDFQNFQFFIDGPSTYHQKNFSQ